ncbi:MAG: LamG-like jellyroll fold domain-containing protein [Verrucomicrobiota bacterium]
MNYQNSVRYGVALAATVVGLSQITAQTPTVLPPEWALPLGAGDSSAPGFNVRVHQANKGSGTLANSIARAEDQLAGVLIDPKTGQPYKNDIDTTTFSFDANGIYTEPATIGYEQGGGGPNGSIPGIPGVDGQNDNIALEAYAWLKLAPGTYTMIVNSDDGFRVSAGADARDKLTSVVLGEYDGGRGTSDSVFQFSVSQAGLYSFRLLYFEGGGDANVYWFTSPSGDATTDQVLVNAADDNSVKAYRKVSASVLPYVSYVKPGKDATGASPSSGIKLKIEDGSPRKVDVASVKLSLDGSAVAATVVRTGSSVSVDYVPPVLLDPLSVHTAQLVFSDDGSPAVSRTNQWSFTVGKYTNIKLPDPLYYEDFESTAEGEIPTGWTRQNFTSGSTGNFDLLDPNSDTYLDWVVISRDTVQAANWDAVRRLQPGENYVNGKLVTQLVQGKFAYAESDNRGGSQVQYLFSKDFDLSGKANIYLAYNSIYEQNQDSLGAVEYSIDGGKTWLPVVYMLDGPDIVRDPQGNVDAVATFNAANTDTATYTDPDTGEDKGGKYGDFIGAAITQDLAPYISARVNDDPIESKRVEFYPLPAAANQKTVRLRFAQAGTGSWYFGVDNVGLYSITVVDPPKINVPPADASAFEGLSFSLAVDASGTGLTYKWLKDDKAIDGATGATYSVASAKTSDSGKYTVEVSNAGGKVTSSAANVVVSVVPGSFPVSDKLALYLKFDGNLVDSSVSKADGTAVGAPKFENALFGQGVRVKTLKDGSQNDYVTLGYPSALKFGDSTDFTVSFWVKVLDQADDQPFISNKDWGSSNNKGWGIFSQGGKNYRVNITGPNGSADKFSKTPGGHVGDGVWHNLTVSVSRTGKVNSYVDGNLNDSSPIATKGSIDTDQLSTPLTFNIGQDGTGLYTDGGGSQIEFVMDDLAIWSRALPAEDVAVLYLGGAAGKSLDQLAASTTPVLSVSRDSEGNAVITYTGVLQSSTSLGGAFAPVPGATSPFVVKPAEGPAVNFYRASN